MSRSIEVLLSRFENCEQAQIHIECCSVDEIYTVVLTLNGAEFARAEAKDINTAVEKVLVFVDSECVEQDLPV